MDYLGQWDNYRPQRSWAKVMFLQACVCPQGGVLPQCMLGYHPPGRPPLDQAPPRTRHLPWDQADTPPGPGRHTPRTRQTPPDQADSPRPGRHHPPPGPGRPPPREADSRIRSTSGWYASYWNAFLFHIVFR